MQTDIFSLHSFEHSLPRFDQLDFLKRTFMPNGSKSQTRQRWAQTVRAALPALLVCLLTTSITTAQVGGPGKKASTNDKAGSKMNLLRWVSARVIKETFDPPKEWRYPFLG